MISEKSKGIFDALEKLANDPTSGFFSRDVSLNGSQFRIYDYHLVSYEGWLNPYALESRGIMFEMRGQEPVRLACRPFEKFFNLNENPFTMDLDLEGFDRVIRVTNKEDGSLISSFMLQDELWLKSKGSVSSEQALAAMKLIRQQENFAFMLEVMNLTANGYTVNMEYCAPDNRIVLEYKEPKLIVLAVRDNETGQYLDRKVLEAYPEISKRLVQEITDFDPNGLIEKILNLKNSEGVVCETKSGKRFKLKSPWYVNLHRVKNELLDDKFLWGLAVTGKIDDVIAGLGDLHDDVVIEKLRRFENAGVKVFNRLKSYLTYIIHCYGNLDRKDYAINTREELLAKDMLILHRCVMNHFIGRSNLEKDIEESMIKLFDQYGSIDELTDKIYSL